MVVKAGMVVKVGVCAEAKAAIRSGGMWETLILALLA